MCRECVGGRPPKHSRHIPDRLWDAGTRSLVSGMRRECVGLAPDTFPTDSRPNPDRLRVAGNPVSGRTGICRDIGQPTC
eukprot:8196998-Lingulodinium_polyedra.AAC.1